MCVRKCILFKMKLTGKFIRITYHVLNRVPVVPFLILHTAQ